VATSALAALAAWIFFSFFVPLGANVVSGALVSDVRDAESVILRNNIEKAVLLMSPLELYTDSTAGIIDPLRRTTRRIIQIGMMEQLSMTRFSGPLRLSQSIIVVMPYMIMLIAITAVCFAISYTVFMRQEIRSL
jgi:ABC-2 type transport system permease protein